MRSIGKTMAICFILCCTFTSFYSCDKAIKKVVKKTTKEITEEGVEKVGKRASKEVIEKSTKVIGRPLPKGGTALSNKARRVFQRQTGLSKNACKDIRTVEQAQIFKKLKLKDFDVPAKSFKGIDVPGRNVKFPEDLPLQTKMKDIPGAKELIESKGGKWDEWKNWTNLDLMGEGRNPIFPADKKRGLKTNWGEVHHDNQTHASNYTILRKEHHTGAGYNDILHDKAPSEIDHQHFSSYESPAMLMGLTKVLETKYGGWNNIPNKILF